jgi:hypothetical protein
MTLLNTTLVGVLSLLAPPSAGRGGSGPDRVVSVTLISVDGSAVESPLPSAACAGGQVLHVHRLTAMPVAQGTPGDALAQLGRWSATVWVGQREGLSVASNEVTVFGDGATVTSVELPGGKPLVQPSFAAARLIGASKSARVGFTVHVAGRCGPAA